MKVCSSVEIDVPEAVGGRQQKEKRDGTCRNRLSENRNSAASQAGQAMLRKMRSIYQASEGRWGKRRIPHKVVGNADVGECARSWGDGGMAEVAGGKMQKMQEVERKVRSKASPKKTRKVEMC